MGFTGSVRWPERLRSNLDVTVERNTPFTWQELAPLREALMESDSGLTQIPRERGRDFLGSLRKSYDLPIRVDVVDWAHCTPKFQVLVGAKREWLMGVAP